MSDVDTETLLRQAAEGDHRAAHRLLDRYRPRLKRMLRVRMDRRLVARLDDSDLVQEVLADAAEQLTVYLHSQPLPFYPWLRRIAERKLVDAVRHHMRQCRDVGREREVDLPEHSAMQLVRRLVCPNTGPSRAVLRQEFRERVRAALAELNDSEREVLVLCYLEKMTITEAAVVLGLSEEAARSRRRRGLQRLGQFLRGLQDEL